MGLGNLYRTLHHLLSSRRRFLRLRSLPTPRLRSTPTQHLVLPKSLPTHAPSIIGLHVDGMCPTPNRNILPSRSW